MRNIETPTAFVTGGTGFVGLNLVECLRDAGWHVIAAHRAHSNTEPLLRMGVEVRLADVLDAEAIAQAMPPGADAVFHVAGATSTWRLKNAEQTRINVEGTRNVVNAALAAGVRRFVYTSSIATYGTAAYTAHIDEGAASDASGHWVNYVRTKWLAEQEVRRGIARGLDAVIVNPANIVGPHDTHNWSRLFRLTANGELPGVPPGRAAWCDVREIARAHVAAAERGRTGHNYLLGGVDASYPEVTRTVAELTGAKAPRAIPAWVMRSIARVNDVTSSVTRQEPEITPESAFFVCGTGTIDSGKAERELGYASRPLRPLLQDALAWMQQQGMIR